MQPVGCVAPRLGAGVRHPAPVVALALSRDGRVLASLGEDGGVLVSDPTSGRVSWTSPEPAEAIAASASWVAVAAAGRVQLVRVATGAVTWSAPLSASHLAFSADGGTLLAAGHGLTALRVATGRVLRSRPEASATAVAALGDGWVVAGEELALLGLDLTPIRSVALGFLAMGLDVGAGRAAVVRAYGDGWVRWDGAGEPARSSLRCRGLAGELVLDPDGCVSGYPDLPATRALVAHPDGAHAALGGQDGVVRFVAAAP